MRTWRTPAWAGLKVVCSASTLMDGSSNRIRTDARSRRSRGSSERQTGQSQPIMGTPAEVPVPRKVRERGMG